MIGWLMRRLLPGRYRKQDTDDLVHRLRNQAQVAKLETHILRMERERRERQDLADALAQSPPPFRFRGEERPR